MLDIGWLTETGPCRKFPAGQQIPCPGGPDQAERAMYILLSGRVDVYKASAAGGTQSVGSLLPGDAFGGREFFTDVHDSTYTAGAESDVFVITEASFNDLSWARPDILFEVMRAAYVPLRKMSAAERAAQVLLATAPEPAPAVKTAGQAKAKPIIVGETEVLETEPTVVGVPISLPSDEGIFPEGHKLYPGVSRPEYSKLVFPKDYTCPYCKRSFNDYRVFRSKLYESTPMRFDLRRYYTDFQTEWYDVITCSNCLFSTFHNYFSEPKPVAKQKIEDELSNARTSVTMNFGGERDIDYVFTSHYLAILCSEGFLSVGKQIRAKLWGNLSWLYEDLEDEEMARFAASKAAAAYEAVFAESRLTPVQEQITCLSIAGMQYRAGEDRNMKRFLFTAKTSRMGDRTYSKLAEDFMYEIKVDDE